MKERIMNNSYGPTGYVSREEFERLKDDKRCTWIENDDGVWETKCDELFEFNEGGPPENRFEFCPYCGKNLKPIRWQRLDV